MTWRRRATGGLATLVTIVLIAGCDATLPPSPPAAGSPSAAASRSSAAPSAATAPPSAAPVAVPPARWSDCGKGFLCADIRVPRDHEAPSDGYLDVALLRLSATDPSDRIGTLVINPGGPGGSGVEFVRAAGESGVIPPALRKRFDIVGFDPRGVNSSTAIRCIDNLDPQARLDPSPDDAGELDELVASARDYAAECAKRNDGTLPYLSTDAVARDLDIIRQAVGDEKLTYLGFSYGTLIGSLYADRFPDRIRAMVLDGAIDPALDLEQLRFGQAEGFEAALASFLDDCAAKPRCAFHEDGKTVAAFDALMASIEKTSLPATLDPDHRRVGPSIAGYAVLAALYDRASWPTLAASLELARRGDGSLLLQIADPYQGRKPNGSYSNQHDAYTANVCLDFAAPTDVATYTDWAERLATSAPHFAGLIAYNDLACSFWPVPAQRVPGPVTAGGAPPILVVGTTGDPATRYAWAKRLADELESGVLITNEGESHTAYLTSSCVQRAVNAYLLGLTVPKPGLTCQ
jgi:pimeloyl-ACP methyl ester carboxylesterase